MVAKPKVGDTVRVSFTGEITERDSDGELYIKDSITFFPDDDPFSMTGQHTEILESHLEVVPGMILRDKDGDIWFVAADGETLIPKHQDYDPDPLEEVQKQYGPLTEVSLEDL